MAVMDSIKAIGHGIGWLIPGVQEAQAMEASTNAHRQKTLNDAINRAIQYETQNPRGADEDPDYKDRITRLFDMQGKVQQMGPFDNPKSIGGQFWHDYISLHPDALMPGQPKQPKVTATPGPPMQGQPAGQPNISMQIPPVGGSPGPSGGLEQSLNATLPGTSPVSPQAQAAAATATQPQGGGSSPNATFPSAQPSSIAGISDQGTGEDSQPVFKTGSTPLGPPPDLTLPPRPAPIRMPVSLSGDVSAPLAQAAILSQQPYIGAQAAAEQALNVLKGTSEFQLAEGPRKIGMLRQMLGQDKDGSWIWDNLPPLVKSDFAADALGMRVSGLGGMFIPRSISNNVLGSDIISGNPNARDPHGNPLDPKQRYNIKLVSGQEVYEPGSAQTHQVYDYDPNTKKFYSVSVDQAGREIGRFETIPPAGYRPVITYQNGIRMVTQPDNTIQAVPIRTSTERMPDLSALGGGPSSQPAPGVTGPGPTVGAVPPNQPAAAPSPAKPMTPSAPRASIAGPGQTVGGKGITPQERIGWEQKLGAASSALEIVKDIRRELPVVQGMIQAKKIDLAIDPEYGLVVHRLLPLNDEEAKLAGDLESMREHINVLRQPLGAAGFRSEDAWGALQAMFGGLGLNPKVADQIIGRTVQSMNRQINAISRGLKGQHDFPTDYVPVSAESSKETKPGPSGATPLPPNLSSTAEQYLRKKGKL